jgi:uncharacterized membrane protein YjgN (DUF898 family)
MNPTGLMALLPLIMVIAIGALAAFYMLRRSNRDWPAVSVPSEGLVKHPVRFEGAAGDFFLKWIGVVFLNIITLGLYSPWGTVRLKRYLYGQTRVGSQHFAFLGDAMAILKGRLLIAGVFIGVMILSNVAPTLYGVVLLLGYLVVLPLVVPQALRYNARTTALSEVAFTFHGTSGGAFLSYVLGTFGSLATLWLAAPMFSRYSLNYRYNNLQWGGRRLRINVSLGQLYGALGSAILAGVITAAVAGMIVWAIVNDMGGSEIAMGLIPVILLYFGIFPAAIAYRALQLRLALGSLSVEGIGRLQCTLPAGRAIFVACSNALVIALTLGLASPWAKVRWLRVLTAELAFEAQPGKLALTPAGEPLPRTATDELAGAVFNVEF